MLYLADQKTIIFDLFSNNEPTKASPSRSKEGGSESCAVYEANASTCAPERLFQSWAAFFVLFIGSKKKNFWSLQNSTKFSTLSLRVLLEKKDHQLRSFEFQLQWRAWKLNSSNETESTTDDVIIDFNAIADGMELIGKFSSFWFLNFAKDKET